MKAAGRMKIFLDFHGREYTVMKGLSGLYYAGRKAAGSNIITIRDGHYYQTREKAEQELAAYAKKRGWQAK